MKPVNTEGYKLYKRTTLHKKTGDSFHKVDQRIRRGGHMNYIPIKVEGRKVVMYLALSDVVEHIKKFL